ncbi:unnamed protein product [Blepharisma stoltei]|uniref:Uncharacterized protein n=1 Tax=Blepharisma stoltei TaxID=1481888 RepID=A0AAU9K318_9CILI|nr:unnamed protein product [Blepharisma stoltei]
MRLFAYAKQFSRAMAISKVPMINLNRQSGLRLVPSLTPLVTRSFLIKRPGSVIPFEVLGISESLKELEEDEDTAILPKTTGLESGS